MKLYYKTEMFPLKRVNNSKLSLTQQQHMVKLYPENEIQGNHFYILSTFYLSKMSGLSLFLSQM